MVDVLSMYPFTNDVMNVEVSGNDLKAMMSHAADPEEPMLHVENGQIQTLQHKTAGTAYCRI